MQYPSNHYSIDDHTKEMFWKLHPELNPKNKKKNLMAIDSSNQVEINSDVDEKIICTSVQKEVNLEYPSTTGRERNDQTLPCKDTGQEDQDCCFV